MSWNFLLIIINNNIIKSLEISCNDLNRIHTHSPDPLHLDAHPVLCLFFQPFALPNYSLVWDLPWEVVDLPGVISLKKTSSPSPSSHQLPIVPQRAVGLWSTSSLHARILLSQVLCMLLQSLWDHMWNCPVTSRKRFPWGHVPPTRQSIIKTRALRIFLLPLLQWPLKPWEQGVHIGLTTSKSHSLPLTGSGSLC